MPIVRRATFEDLEPLVRLLRAQLGEHGIELAPDEIRRGAEGLWRRPGRGLLLVAQEGSDVVGFAALSHLWTLEHGGRATWLDELYVVPGRRSKGIGRELLRRALREAREAGAIALDLEVERGHERVASLYEREGFRRLDRQRWSRPVGAADGAAEARDVPLPLFGGCACGEVRYRIDEPPIEVGHCHCGLCRRSSGAPVVTWATVPRPGFSWTGKEPAERRSSESGTRSFCSRCGAQLAFREGARESWIDVTVASLDDPDAVEPDHHIFTASGVRWLAIDDDLPRHPAASPLEPTNRRT